LKSWLVGHWRGELRLWVSFWVLGAGVYILNRLFVAALQPLEHVASKALDPGLVLLAEILLQWMVATATWLWWLVGTWRSAKQPQYKGKTRAALTALIVMGVFAAVAIGLPVTTFVRALDVFNEYRDDPQTGPRGIRILDNGAELEIYGTISRSVPDALSLALDSHRHVSLVRLDSKGGRLEPALKMLKIIRARKLDTVVTSECFSVCTIVFLGGKERWMAEDAKLDFHSANAGGQVSPPADDRMKKSLSDSGVSRKFLNENTDSLSVSYPTADDLRTGGVITNVCMADDCSGIE
jgi:hypothetical protein